MTILVVGSGPSGAFAALGALEAGAPVLMVDSGLQLEPDAQEFKEKLGDVDWKILSNEERNEHKKSYDAFTSNLSNRRVFGSDFSTRNIEPARTRERKCWIRQSYALAGLSNIWGRGVEPPYSGEFEHWSFKEDFIQSLRAVLSYIPFSAETDNLAEVMPLYSNLHVPHMITPESQDLLKKWKGNKNSLNDGGIHFGKTRLAMRQGARKAHGCQLCTMCFYGCPYGAMFDSSEIISTLSARYPDFTYKPGLLVRKFNTLPDGNIRVVAENLKKAKDEFLVARKLVLAAGPPQTTTIVMRSIGIEQATLKNSDLIRIPFIKIIGRASAEDEFHSLSQLTLTVDHRKITKRAVVIHLFGKNPMITSAVLNLFPASWRATLEKILNPFFSRLYIGLCFLHSDDSREIHVKDDGETTRYDGKSRKKIARIYLRLLWVFLKRVNETGLLPIPGIGGVSPPGSSAHIGSSIPIDGTSALSTDNRGQLDGYRSVYVADASSLPEIPAGSYTLSIMANAHRIGNTVGARET